jgi:hypothetical protein
MGKLSAVLICLHSMSQLYKYCTIIACAQQWSRKLYMLYSTLSAKHLYNIQNIVSGIYSGNTPRAQ